MRAPFRVRRARRSRPIRYCREKVAANRANGYAKGKHCGANRDMRGRHVGGFLTPDHPGAQGDLTGEQQEPAVANHSSGVTRNSPARARKHATTPTAMARARKR